MAKTFNSDDKADKRDQSIHDGFFRTEGFRVPKVRLPRVPFGEGVDDTNGNALVESLRKLGIRIPGGGGGERKG